MTERPYARSGLTEHLRQLCRMADLLLLLAALRWRRHLPAIPRLRRTVLVELGPGPTRLASLKRRIFDRVIFLDQSDFGIPDPDLRIANLEDMEAAEHLLSGWCGIDAQSRMREAPVLFFADHCLEHVSEQKLLPFLNWLARSGHAACFRVPNTLSARGLYSFQKDPTHRTAFEPELRSRLNGMGFAIFPWLRWYRPGLLLKAIVQREVMKQAEEIAICVSAFHAAARDGSDVSRRSPLGCRSSRPSL